MKNFNIHRAAQDYSVDLMLKPVAGLSILSDDEVKLLVEQIANGDKSACDTLIRHNLRLVVLIAKEYNTAGVPLEDVIAAGAMGLVRAAPQYVFNEETKFISYASICIRRSIEFELARMSRTIRLSKGASIYIAELKKKLNDGGILEGKDALLYQVSLPPESLDSFKAPIDDGGQISPNLSHITYEEEVSSEDIILQKEITGIITREMDRMLTPREAMVLKKHYGFIGKAPMTYEELGDEFGVSKAMVGTIVLKAREKLSKSRIIKNYHKM